MDLSFFDLRETPRPRVRRTSPDPPDRTRKRATSLGIKRGGSTSPRRFRRERFGRRSSVGCWFRQRLGTGSRWTLEQCTSCKPVVGAQWVDILPLCNCGMVIGMVGGQPKAEIKNVNEKVILSAALLEGAINLMQSVPWVLYGINPSPASTIEGPSSQNRECEEC